MNSIEQLLKLNNTLRTYNISFSVFIFVASLESENRNLKEISDLMHISSAGMTTIRDCAEDNGFIELVKSDDRREKIYKITDKGIELLASCRQ